MCRWATFWSCGHAISTSTSLRGSPRGGIMPTHPYTAYWLGTSLRSFLPLPSILRPTSFVGKLSKAARLKGSLNTVDLESQAVGSEILLRSDVQISFQQVSDISKSFDGKGRSYIKCQSSMGSNLEGSIHQCRKVSHGQKRVKIRKLVSNTFIHI